MAEKYRKISDYDYILFDPDSPVVVEKMRLQHDLLYNVNVLQITFRNVDPLNIYGLGIGITLRDDAGRKLYKEIEFNYYGIEVPQGKTFGTDEDIVVEPDATQFDISIIRADLAEGRRFHTKVTLKKMPPGPPTETLEEFEEPFIERVKKIKPKANITCAPENNENYWRCVCGRVYPNDMTICPVCKLKRLTLISIVPDLKQEKKEREIEEARLEKERLAEEERQRQEEEKRRLEEEERQRQEEERRKKEEEERRIEQERLEKLKKAKRKKIIILSSVAAAVIAALIVIIKVRSARQPEVTQVAETEADVYETVYQASVESVKPEDETKSAKEPEKLRDNMVILGGDLDETETNTVWRLFGRNEKSLGKHDTFTVGTEEQKGYIEMILGQDNLESRAVSSVLVIPMKSGYGLNIKMYNILGCTGEMYAEALKDVGITDADVVIAAPQKESGSTALTGIYKLRDHSEDYIGKAIGVATAKRAINVRAGNSTDYPIYTTLHEGDTVEVLELLDNGWFRIVWPDSLCGYAYSCYSNGTYYDFVPAE